MQDLLLSASKSSLDSADMSLESTVLTTVEQEPWTSTMLSCLLATAVKTE